MLKRLVLFSSPVSGKANMEKAILSPSTTITGVSLLSRPSRLAFVLPTSSAFPRNRRSTKFLAKLGGGDGEAKRPERKFITREEEPEQYWQTAGEREGENPMKTPLPYIIIFGMSTPFVILAIAFANGWIKVPVR